MGLLWKANMKNTCDKQDLFDALTTNLEASKLSDAELGTIDHKCSKFDLRTQDTDLSSLAITVLIVLISIGIAVLNPFEPLMIGGFHNILNDNDEGFFYKLWLSMSYFMSFMVCVLMLTKLANTRRYKGIEIPTTKERKTKKDSIERFKAISSKILSQDADSHDLMILMRLIQQSQLIEPSKEQKILSAIALMASEFGSKEVSYEISSFASKHINDEDIHFMTLRDSAEKGSLKASQELNEMVMPKNHSGTSSGFAAGLILGAVIF